MPGLKGPTEARDPLDWGGGHYRKGMEQAKLVSRLLMNGNTTQ